jgi:hypothetical protein
MSLHITIGGLVACPIAMFHLLEHFIFIGTCSLLAGAVVMMLASTQL